MFWSSAPGPRDLPAEEATVTARFHGSNVTTLTDVGSRDHTATGKIFFSLPRSVATMEARPLVRVGGCPVIAVPPAWAMEPIGGGSVVEMLNSLQRGDHGCKY